MIFLTAGEMYYEQYRRLVYPEVSADKIIRKPISNDELVRIIHGYFETPFLSENIRFQDTINNSTGRYKLVFI